MTKIDSRLRGNDNPKTVVPAKAGTQHVDSRVRGNDVAHTADQRLMARIRERWGAAITEACRYSSVPEQFLAALVANESGQWILADKPIPPRFEKLVFNKLIAVQQGSLDHYGHIRREHLARLTGIEIKELASSWGLTQIMGCHTVGRPGGLSLIREDAGAHLKFALGLLAKFAEQYGLNVTLEFTEMFRCWNTGHPYDDPKTPRIEGRTHDPKYVERGLARMKIYKEFGHRGTEAQSL